MSQNQLVVLTSYLAQAFGGLVLVGLLFAFHRLYRRDFLRQWAWSWVAFCVYLTGFSGALVLASDQPPTSPLRIAVAGLALAAGFVQVAPLLAGTWEVTTGRRVEERWLRPALFALALAGAGVVLVSVQLSPTWRTILRVGPRAALAGAAFLGAGWVVLWFRRRTPGLGSRLLGGSFVLYGLQLAHTAVLAARMASTGPPGAAYLATLGVLDLVCQALIGLGMVVWLLEEERERVVAASQRIEHLAFHDALTDLPNRNLFLDHLGLALRRAGRTGTRVAVMFLDLDRFKVINDSLGHASGDELLQGAAERLRRSVRGGDTVARMGGDEFAVLLTGVGGDREVLQVADRILAAIRRPFLVGGREVFVAGSLGVSRSPEDGDDPEALLLRADLAMYRAKERGRDNVQVFATGMDARALDRLALESDLRRALAREELELHFQPILGARTGEVAGVEALVRWRHPERGLLPPKEFLWLAEAAGLSDALDIWVLRTACREVRRWREEGAADLRVTVNLSARAFQGPGLADRVREVLAESGLPAAALEIEITETLAMQEAEASLAVLSALKDLGVRLSIDDFGTGYTSLAYLRNFPVDTLKVDQSFVRSLAHGDGSVEIAAAVIALAHTLGLGVVAEGVEDERQWRLLVERGCDLVQGFLFSRPLPAAECRRLVLAGAPLAPLRGLSEDGHPDSPAVH